MWPFLEDKQSQAFHLLEEGCQVLLSRGRRQALDHNGPPPLRLDLGLQSRQLCPDHLHVGQPPPLGSAVRRGRRGSSCRRCGSCCCCRRLWLGGGSRNDGRLLLLGTWALPPDHHHSWGCSLGLDNSTCPCSRTAAASGCNGSRSRRWSQSSSNDGSRLGCRRLYRCLYRCRRARGAGALPPD